MRSLILAADDISPWEIDQKKQQNKTNTKCFPPSFMKTISIVDGWGACTLSCALSPFEWNE